MPVPPVPVKLEEQQNLDDFERDNVHTVYNHIADHFSATRYKAWPVVEDFLQNLSPGSLGADVGCGNGKYMGVNPNVMVLGSDVSSKLVEICHERGFEVLVSNNLELPYRSNSFDFCLSIAVIHHFSNSDRRVQALKEISRILRPGGRMLVFVWAFEQQGRRKFEDQDVFVPWQKWEQNTTTNAGNAGQSSDAGNDTGGKVYNRYYHLFKEKELETEMEKIAGIKVVGRGYDRDNWYAIAEKIASPQ
ncbi:S-adenosyl-L-methionine-dependent methyltransferase [Cladochytrium replicatum]|nr:S-adenosyl-L-methionine-dependent methyltransferase [Cladochytrium replicatum]